MYWYWEITSIILEVIDIVREVTGTACSHVRRALGRGLGKALHKGLHETLQEAVHKALHKDLDKAAGKAVDHDPILLDLTIEFPNTSAEP